MAPWPFKENAACDTITWNTYSVT